MLPSVNGVAPHIRYNLQHTLRDHARPRLPAYHCPIHSLLYVPMARLSPTLARGYFSRFLLGIFVLSMATLPMVVSNMERRYLIIIRGPSAVNVQLVPPPNTDTPTSPLLPFSNLRSSPSLCFPASLSVQRSFGGEFYDFLNRSSN